MGQRLQTKRVLARPSFQLLEETPLHPSSAVGLTVMEVMALVAVVLAVEPAHSHILTLTTMAKVETIPLLNLQRLMTVMFQLFSKLPEVEVALLWPPSGNHSLTIQRKRTTNGKGPSPCKVLSIRSSP